MTRYLFGFMCVLALGVMPMVGCGETEGTGGTGGSAGIGGVGGEGGMSGSGGGGSGGDGGMGGGGTGGMGGTAGMGGTGGMGGMAGTAGMGGTGGMGGDGGTAGTGGVAEACGAAGTGGAGGMAPITRMIPVACCNNVTGCRYRAFPFGEQPYELTVDPQGPVAPGAPIMVDLGGKAAISETALNTFQGMVPGGVTQVDLVDVAATVQVRTGGTMAPVVLTNDPMPATCLIFGESCDPANDAASVPGSRANSDCSPLGAFNPCQQLVTVPTSDDCSVGGVCDLIGKGPGTSQCDVNGFCVTGDMEIPLEAEACAFTADASGDVLFGWAEDVPGQSENPDRSIAPPPAIFTDPVAPIGMRFNMGGLSFKFQCTMAREGDYCVGGADDGFACADDGDCAGGGNCSGGIADVFVPVPDADLISIPVVE